MLLKNTVGGVFLYAFDTVANVPKTGDAANITGYRSLDGTVTATVFSTANPTEIDATHLKGVYWQPLTAAETNGNATAYAWSSTTANITIDPVIGFTGPTVAVRKNVALANFEFPMVLADHSTPATGKTIAAYRSIDGAAFGICANGAVEIVDATRPGWYHIDLAAADLNGTVIALNFAEATCDTTQLVIITQP